jgi:GSH-dependent disulfide-bond oxidoreductase
MIDLHTAGTPNGHKASIMLEEVGLPYQVFPVNISEDEQFHPDFVEISPWSKIPVIVDHDPIGGGEPFTVFESGAILMYLAEKTGKLMPQEPRARYDVIKWLMMQIGGFGPLMGQLGHFEMYASEDVPYAKKRYRTEVDRLLGVLDDRLENSQFMAGDDYSIADVATFPWVRLAEMAKFSWDDFSNIKRWVDEIAARPAVQKGLDVP